MTMVNTPTVSIVVPMYNTEKYIRQCLISVLSQKFTDFEVIVVDDCSKDNSVAEVEKLIPHFDERLKLICRNEQSGCAGIPRNDGIKAANGKYIVFLDSDDMLLPTTLRDYVEIAETTKADILHTEKVLVFHDDGREFRRDELVLAANENGDLVENVTFETKDLAQRIRYWVKRGYNWEPYTMFCRRDFLVRNQIQFPKMRSYGDMLFSFAVLCQTEKFLRVPNLTYIYKKRQGSVSYENRDDIPARFRKYAKVMNDGFNAYEKIMDEIKFFAEHPDYRYAVLDFYMNDVLYSTQPYYAKKPPFEFNEFIKEAFHPDDAALAAHLFNTVNIWRSQLMRLQQEKLNGKK